MIPITEIFPNLCSLLCVSEGSDDDGTSRSDSDRLLHVSLPNGDCDLGLAKVTLVQRRLLGPQQHGQSEPERMRQKKP